VHLIVPVPDNANRLIGVLLLGEKKSEEPYSGNDRRMLQAVARHAAAARENLRLRAKVAQDHRIRHDVLARLDGALPDLLKECPACGACYEGAVERCDRDGRELTLSLPVSRTLDGKYRLVRLIGKGGMGAVYEARDLRLNRVVAVKILLGRAFGQRTALRRFQREARAAARLSHPNIVSVYDFGELHGEGAFLVMERVEGVTMRTALQRAGSFPPAEAADWFDQLLAGIAAAHAAGIVHRDLKPENVIGLRAGAAAVSVKILDFGLARMPAADDLTSESLTLQGSIMGTLGYMAPEQLLGGDVDDRVDLFAAGVMLAEALTGRTTGTRWRN
jgi:serine/threonine protein kinase